MDQHFFSYQYTKQTLKKFVLLRTLAPSNYDSVVKRNLQIQKIKPKVPDYNVNFGMK